LLPLLGLTTLWPNIARAIDATSVDPPLQPQPSFADLWQAVTQFGGARAPLEEAGVKFTFTYYGDALGNPSGGVYQRMATRDVLPPLSMSISGRSWAGPLRPFT
jgi:hypothetical protein